MLSSVRELIKFQTLKLLSLIDAASLKLEIGIQLLKPINFSTTTIIDFGMQ